MWSSLHRMQTKRNSTHKPKDPVLWSKILLQRGWRQVRKSSVTTKSPEVLWCFSNCWLFPIPSHISQTKEAFPFRISSFQLSLGWTINTCCSQGHYFFNWDLNISAIDVPRLLSSNHNWKRPLQMPVFFITKFILQCENKHLEKGKQ